MSRVTRFSVRDTGPSARMVGFLAHLRENHLRLGAAETQLALSALTHVNAALPEENRRALKAICTGCREEIKRFDELFDSYWLNNGRVRTKAVPTFSKQTTNYVRSSQMLDNKVASGSGSANAPDGGTGEAEVDGQGKLVATKVRNMMRKDLRELVQAEDIAAARLVAERLGAALRYRRSRRRHTARKGDQLNFRKIIRNSLSSGGEPLRLIRKRRPDRPYRIAAICDVSGSMSVYAQVFLAFLVGLMRADPNSDAYLFHTRLIRITEVLREKDAMRAIGRMSLMADGFGGGSRIGSSLHEFSTTYARRFVDGRTAVLILSDGYDADSPGILADALTRLRKRGCKIIWLNPLKNWEGYAPVANGMATALPHLDLFAAANTLDDLANLDREFLQL